MSTAIATLNAASAQWFTLVVAVVWQSTLLAVLVALIAMALRGSSPAVRYWLWQIVAIKLLLMPFWSWSVPVPWPIAAKEQAPEPIAPTAVSTAGLDIAPPAEQVAPPPTEDVLAPPTSPSRPSIASSLRAVAWQSWLLVAWAVIVLLQVVRLAWQRVQLSGLLRQSTAADVPLRSLVAEIARAMSLGRTATVLLTRQDCSPFVCGVWRPRLVLPAGLVGSLETAELRQVVAHELAHVKRRDLVWGWIPEIARIIYFFHPVAHWVAWRVRLERELSCDQLAMSVSGHTPGEYAQTLVRVVSHTSQPAALKAAIAPLAGGGVGSASAAAARSNKTGRDQSVSPATKSAEADPSNHRPETIP